MADFKGVSERFNLQMLSEDGYDSDRVVVVIGLDGLLIKTADGSRTLRKYPLNHISRWALRGSSLVRLLTSNKQSAFQPFGCTEAKCSLLPAHGP